MSRGLTRHAMRTRSSEDTEMLGHAGTTPLRELSRARFFIDSAGVEPRFSDRGLPERLSMGCMRPALVAEPLQMGTLKASANRRFYRWQRHPNDL